VNPPKDGHLSKY